MNDERTIEIAGDTVDVSFPYDNKLVTMMGNLGCSRYYDPDARAYFVPIDYAEEVDLLDLLQQEGFELT